MTGSNPTAIKARMWLEGTTEPTTWQVQATYSTSQQGAGAVGLFAYQPGSATGTIKVRLDNLSSKTL